MPKLFPANSPVGQSLSDIAPNAGISCIVSCKQESLLHKWASPGGRRHSKTSRIIYMLVTNISITYSWRFVNTKRRTFFRFLPFAHILAVNFVYNMSTLDVKSRTAITDCPALAQTHCACALCMCVVPIHCVKILCRHIVLIFKRLFEFLRSCLRISCPQIWL